MLGLTHLFHYMLVTLSIQRVSLILELSTSMLPLLYYDEPKLKNWKIITSTWLGLYSVTPFDLNDHHVQFCHMAGLPACTHSYLKGIWHACVWVIWKDRNDRIFQNQITHPSVSIEKVKLHSFLWMKAKHISFNYCYYDWWTHLLLCAWVYTINLFCLFLGSLPSCGSLRL